MNEYGPLVVVEESIWLPADFAADRMSEVLVLDGAGWLALFPALVLVIFGLVLPVAGKGDEDIMPLLSWLLHAACCF